MRCRRTVLAADLGGVDRRRPLRRSISEPLRFIVPAAGYRLDDGSGSTMPDLGLAEEEIEDLTAYLASLR